MDMDMAEVFNFRFPSQCSTPCLWWFAFAVFSFCCQSQLSCLLAFVLFMEVMRLLFTCPLSSRLSLIRVCRQEPSLAILFSFFGGTLYESEFSTASKGTISRSF